MVSCKNSSFYKFFPSQIKFCGGVLNSYDLIKVITAIVPFVGYVKAVNALGVLSLVKQDESVKPVVESKASLPSTKKEATPSKKEEKEATAKTEVKPTEKIRTPVSQNQRNQSKKKH